MSLIFERIFHIFFKTLPVSADMEGTKYSIVGDSIAGGQSSAAASGFTRIIETGQGVVVDYWILFLTLGVVLIGISIVSIINKNK